MKEPLKILDKYDKKENIYKLILQFAEKGHKILSSGVASISDDSLNILDAILKDVEEEKMNEHRKSAEKDG